MRVLGMCIALACTFLTFSESRPAVAGYFLSGNQLYDLCNSDERRLFAIPASAAHAEWLHAHAKIVELLSAAASPRSWRNDSRSLLPRSITRSAAAIDG